MIFGSQSSAGIIRMVGRFVISTKRFISIRVQVLEELSDSTNVKNVQTVLKKQVGVQETTIFAKLPIYCN